MAIAFNAAADLGNNGGTTNSLTASYTCSSGADRLLIVHFDGDVASGADDITGVTYAGTSMTQLGKVVAGGSQARNVYTYYLLGPATGANNVVISCTASHYLIAVAGDYTGISATGEPDASKTDQSIGTATTLTTSLTSITDNDWEILGEGSYNANNPPSAGTGATRRTFDAAFGAVGLFDSGGVITPAGSYSMTTTRTTAANSIEHICGDFLPSAAAALVWGWELLPLGVPARRFRPCQPEQPAERYPFTAVNVAGPYGWYVKEEFPSRRRARMTPPEEFVFRPLGALTPTQLGFVWDAMFPVRRRFQPIQEEQLPEQYPFTAVKTTGSFGWYVPEQFPARRRARLLAIEDFVIARLGTLTPTQLGFLWDAVFPARAKSRQLYQAAPDPIILAAGVAQLIFQYIGPVWRRRRSRPQH